MKLFNRYHIALALIAALITVLAITSANARDNRDPFPHEANTEWRTTTYYDESPTIIPGRGQIVIDANDRTIIRDYMGRNYAIRCLAGETISPNGCVPIGKMRQTTRTTTTVYTVGQPLSETVVYTDVPPSLITQLQPVPTGYEYVVVDGDVVLLSPSHQVIDAVTWVPVQ